MAKSQIRDSWDSNLEPLIPPACKQLLYRLRYRAYEVKYGEIENAFFSTTSLYQQLLADKLVD
jgi:hypothetical protein